MENLKPVGFLEELLVKIGVGPLGLVSEVVGQPSRVLTTGRGTLGILLGELGDVLFEVANPDVDGEPLWVAQGSEGDVAEEGGLARAGVTFDDEAPMGGESLLEILVFVIPEVDEEPVYRVSVGRSRLKSRDSDVASFGAEVVEVRSRVGERLGTCS